MTIPGRDDDLEVLPELLQLTLDTLVGTFDQAGVDLPERQYIAFGDVVVDCEQLTVQFQQLVYGPPGGDPNSVQRCDGPRSVSLLVQLFRCVPTTNTPRGGAPTPEAIAASTKTHLRDAWLLMDALAQVDAATWKSGVVGEVSPVSPNGGFAGASLSIMLQVP